MLLCEVALPVPLGQAFTYAVPDALRERLQPGMRVACELRRRREIGVVLSIRDGEPPIAASKLKSVQAVLDAQPCVPAELLAFLRDLSAYYLAPIGEVLRLAMPALERSTARELQQQGLLGNREKVLAARTERWAIACSGVEPAKRLGPAAGKLLGHLRATVQAPVSLLKQTFPTAPELLRKLAVAGLVTIEERERAAEPLFGVAVERDTPPELTAEQHVAVQALQAALGERAAQAFLLHGVTGSGKTEVYMRAIASCLEQGRGALVLVPEIALTPQLVGRFRARFGDVLAVLHSGLHERARHQMWTRLREARVRVAIGARSALFAPVPELGLVVVDEEHDGSFKQEEGVRYHARDMALLRAHKAGAVCVLGSATPSLESEALVRDHRLTRLALPTRAHSASRLPSVEIVDLRRTGAGPTGHPLLSITLHRAIESALAAREQIILFLNRRGFAPSVLCEGCGAIVRCPHCSVSLTLHRVGGAHLRCHYCDHEAPMPTACPECNCQRLQLVGLGTERLEDTLASAFPQARIARLDRDVAAGAKSEAVLAKMRCGEADILVGTQMVTKGHDLPDVTLVGVILADAALSMPDFRASERTFQLLVQVAGRAGRAERKGRVVVQTRLPEHPVLRFAAKHDVRGFVEHELGSRREAGYPPFSRLALVRLDCTDEQRVRDEAARLAQIALESKPVRDRAVEVLGPSPAPVERVRGRFRWRLLLRSEERVALRSAAWSVLQASHRSDRSVRVVVDIDPVQML